MNYLIDMLNNEVWILCTTMEERKTHQLTFQKVNTLFVLSHYICKVRWILENKILPTPTLHACLHALLLN